MKPKNNIFPGAIYEFGDQTPMLYEVISLKGKWVLVQVIKTPIESLIGHRSHIDVNHIRGAKLDHDILGMLGFACSEPHVGISVYDYAPTTTVLGKYSFEAKYMVREPSSGYSFGYIQYVHQLQQIYLALHGVLLELK